MSYSPCITVFRRNTSSERPLSNKVSENHKINVIGPTELMCYGRSKMLYLTLRIPRTLNNHTYSYYFICTQINYSIY